MKLWLIRHAKSAWGDRGLPDFQRPLNKRGQRDGPVMADWLSRQTDPATWLWTSSANRALATAAFVRQGFALDEDRIVALDELYHASPEQILDVIRRTPPEVESVALVAHNPGLTWLVNTMASEPVTDNLPTFGIARFHCPEPWPRIGFHQAELELLVSPKTISPATSRERNS